MGNLESIRLLLENGVITKSEYEIFVKRLDEKKSDYEETWGEILDDFYDWCVKNYSLSTSKGYKTCLYKFILHLTKKDNNIDALNEKFELYSFTKVNNFINKMYDENFSNQSISKTKYAINVLSKYLRELGIDAPEVNEIKISIQKEVNQTTIALRHEEVMEIANIGELRNRACILLCYEGTLKRVELCNIKVQDFDFSNHQLIVYNNDNKIDRVCVLSDYTVEVVKEYIEDLYSNINSWNKSRIKKGRTPREDFGYIFQSVKIVKPSYSVLQTMLKNNAKEYYKNKGFSDIEILDKIKNITFESIRNSRRVYLLSKGYSVNDVMRMCGDKNYMSTYRFDKLVPLLYPKPIAN